MRLKKNFLLKGVSIFNRGVEMFQKKERLDKNGAEKIEGGCDPQRNNDNSNPKTTLV